MLAWIFCSCVHKSELAKFWPNELLSKGTDIKASNPPAPKPINTWIISFGWPLVDFLVTSSVSKSGTDSNNRFRVLLSILKLICPVKFCKSVLAKLIATKPALKARNDKAALLLSKNVMTAGSSTNPIRIASVML